MDDCVGEVVGSGNGNGVVKYCHGHQPDSDLYRYSCVRIAVTVYPDTDAEWTLFNQAMGPMLEAEVQSAMQGTASCCYLIMPATVGCKEPLMTWQLLVHPMDFGSCVACFLCDTYDRLEDHVFELRWGRWMRSLSVRLETARGGLAALFS
ncbi:hypothetical protein GGI35DRAFT_198795 [Trichoderma velutinum]